MQCLHNALIRTHHITSRKKVAKLKQAATFHNVFVLLRYGGAPGVMYVEGQEEGVNRWVSDVKVSPVQSSPVQQKSVQTRKCFGKTYLHCFFLVLANPAKLTTYLYPVLKNLRYKDYQLVARAAAVRRENTPDAQQMKRTGLFESETVKDFGSQMQQRGVYAWWREAMGFTGSYDGGV